MLMMFRLTVIVLISAVWTTSANAHGGQTDGYGGHNNRKAGNYHFHQGPLAGRTFSSKAEAIRALEDRLRDEKAEPAPERRPEPPTKTKPGRTTIYGVGIAPEARLTPYERSDYDYPQSIELSIIAQQGGIFSPYSLRCFAHRGETDIEHIVAMSEAHDSGMSSRTDEERKKFGNDLDNLTLAAPRLNRTQKVAKDPANWLPEYNRCWYVAKYIEIKKKYGLTMDTAEAAAVQAVYESCETFEMTKPECN